MSRISRIWKKRFVNGRDWFAAQAVVAGTSHNTDDFVVSVVLWVESKPASQRIFVWKKPPHEELVDDHCIRVRAEIAPLNRPAGYQRNAQRSEKSLSDPVSVCCLRRCHQTFLSGSWASGNAHARQISIARQQADPHGTHLQDSGQSGEFFAHSLDIWSDALRRISGLAGIHGSVGKVFAIKPDIQPLQVLQRAA